MVIRGSGFTTILWTDSHGWFPVGFNATNQWNFTQDHIHKKICLDTIIYHIQNPHDDYMFYTIIYLHIHIYQVLQSDPFEVVQWPFLLLSDLELVAFQKQLAKNGPRKFGYPEIHLWILGLGTTLLGLHLIVAHTNLLVGHYCFSCFWRPNYLLIWVDNLALSRPHSGRIWKSGPSWIPSLGAAACGARGWPIGPRDCGGGSVVQ